MEEFFKHVASTVVGLFVFGVIMTVLTFVCIAGMALGTSSSPSLESNSVLVLQLSGALPEQATQEMDLSLTGMSSLNQPGLNTTLSAIKKAQTDDRIKGIYLETGDIDAEYATLQQVRKALADFRKSGKWVIAYDDHYGQEGYYLASVADKVYMNPEGELDWHGLGSMAYYVKDLAAKFGVTYNIIKVGKFKSATEMFTEDKMSDANREQVTKYVQTTWQQILSDVAASRSISKDSLNKYADGLVALEENKQLVARKMIDGFCYYDEIKNVVKKQLGIEADKEICQVTVDDMNAAVADETSGDEIAVYYCEGEISSNLPKGLGATRAAIVSHEVISGLEALAQDDNVKAVVLRVNSPGGEAYASEQIWRAVKQLDQKKPVVVSMGDYAASGGYYMSSGARYIIAEPTTLTGSIGIFGVLRDVSDLLNQKLGVKFDEVKTNRNSLFGTANFTRHMNDEEVTALQAYVNRGYTLFRKRVADGRKMKVEDVEKIAQGRVWTGADAKGIKLVDALGGLDEAIAKAAELAKVENYHKTDYPLPPSKMDQILSSVTGAGKGTYLDEQMHLLLGDLYQPLMTVRQWDGKATIQASLPYILEIH